MPDAAHFGLGVVAMAAIIGLAVLGMRVISAFFEPNDPKRAMAIRAVLWIAVGILMAIFLELRQ